MYQVLTNPLMGGTYAYMRHRTERRLDAEGALRKKTVRVPREEWAVLLEGRHEGYVTWEEWLAIQERLAANSIRAGSGAPREGRALLQGLAVCGTCGRKLQTQYGSGVRYVCQESSSGTGGEGRCQSASGAAADDWVAERFLDTAGPAGVEAALQAEREAAEREAAEREAGRLRGYRLEAERCEYEARLAERRYRAEDPDNRLVMRALAREWEAALGAAERARRAWERAAERAPRLPDARAAAELFAHLGARVRELWDAAAVEDRDRKRLLATLVEEVVLDARREAGSLHVLLRWRGGWIDETELPCRRAGSRRGTAPQRWAWCAGWRSCTRTSASRKP